MKFLINIAFSTAVQRTERVIKWAEAFGLGLEDKKFHVYKDLELDVNKGDVVYLTGESGSGKSQLLRKLAQLHKEAGLTVADIDEVALSDEPLVDQLGQTLDEGARLLSSAAIGDAKIGLSKPSQLSDGQRYRLRIAKLIESGADVWVADEFGAVLDRETAKVVAFNLQKQARRVGATVIVATTHRDLLEELAPNLLVDKRYQDKVELRYEGDTVVA